MLQHNPDEHNIITPANSNLGQLLLDIPYSERIVLLPHCMRSNYCKAPKGRFGVIDCLDCGSQREDSSYCLMPILREGANEVGYKGIYIMSGASAIPKLLQGIGLPKAILGVACPIELIGGQAMLSNSGVVCQLEQLVSNGCSETQLFESPEKAREVWMSILTKYPPRNR